MRFSANCYLREELPEGTSASLSLGSVQFGSDALLRSSFKPISERFQKGEPVERIQSTRGLENALSQCHKVMEAFDGSEETLAHIRRVEESLRRLIAEAD